MKPWMWILLVVGVVLIGLSFAGITGYFIYTRVFRPDHSRAEMVMPRMAWHMQGERREEMRRFGDSKAGERDELHSFLHEQMIAAFAEKLGLTAEDIQQRLDDGESLHEIATAQGLTDGEYVDSWQAARDTALDRAVEEGLLDAEQADAMKEHSPFDGFRGFRRGR